MGHDHPGAIGLPLWPKPLVDQPRTVERAAFGGAIFVDSATSSGASHGATDDSRSVTTGSAGDRAFPALRSNTTFMPFCGFFGNGIDTIACFRRYLEDSTSGLERPAAVSVETIQVHGGVRIASAR